MLELFALGTIWFWLALFILGTLVTVLVECEEGGWATLTLIATIFLFHFGLKIDIIKSLMANPWVTLGWVLVYFAAGAVWGLLKWIMFVHKRLGLYKDARATFLKCEGATELTPALALKLQNALNSVYSEEKVSANPPVAGNYKSDIIRWMSYWPFSIVGTLLNDVVRRAWQHVYTFMIGTYDRISVRIFGKYAADTELAKQGLAVGSTTNDKSRH